MLAIHASPPNPSLLLHAGHIPYMPKARVVYAALEGAVRPRQRNIVTSEDGDYWRAVRAGTAPCFSMSNLKKVGGSLALLPATFQSGCILEPSRFSCGSPLRRALLRLTCANSCRHRPLNTANTVHP